MPIVWILLPALNEEEGILNTMRNIPKNEINSLGYQVRILVMDGRSTDRTVEISKNEGAEVLIQKGPKGKGTGVKEAFQYLIKNSSDEDLVCMMDADGTYPTVQIPEICQLLNDYKVVMGSRLRGRISKGSMSITNYFGNYFLSLFASMINLRRTTDVCTGLWGFRAEVLEHIIPRSHGFAVEAELFTKVTRNKLNLIEIPSNYSNRDGKSHLIWYIDGPKIFLNLILMRFRRFR